MRVLGLGALLLATSCGGESGQGSPSSASPRIAVMAPAAAEILEALDASAHLVAVGDYVRAPDRAEGLLRIGAYDTPNLEVLVQTGAEVYISSVAEAARGSHERVRGLGIRVLALDLDTFEGNLEAIRQVGDLVGRAPQAEALAVRVAAGVDSVRASVEGLPVRRVLFVVGRSPLYVAGPASLLGEMIRAAGGEPVSGGQGGAYRLFSLEAALDAGPDVIIDTSDNTPGAVRGRTPGTWGRWDFLPAVAAGRVYHVHPERLVIPGPRIVEAARLLARMIHPDALGLPGPDAYGPLREKPDGP